MDDEITDGELKQIARDTSPGDEGTEGLDGLPTDLEYFDDDEED